MSDADLQHVTGAQHEISEDGRTGSGDKIKRSI